MQVRSSLSLAIALTLLASSGALGILVHDAQVGGPTAATLEPGDLVRLRGSVTPLGADSSLVWLATDGWDGKVLITSELELPRDGVWVFESQVLSVVSSERGDTLLLQALDFAAPYWFD